MSRDPALEALIPLVAPQPLPESLGRRRRNPGVRLLAFIGTLLAGVVAVGLVTGIAAAAGYRIPLPATLWGIVVSVAAYLVLVLVVERRHPPQELALRRATGLVTGCAWGLILCSACVGILALAGVYRVHGLDPGYNVWPDLVSLGLAAAITEEILFRGIMYRLLEDWLGTWLATGISGLVFGLGHLGNPQASMWGAIAIALEAGVLFAALYALTRSLWVVIGLHFAWNMAQGPLYGSVVSGSSEAGRGWLVASMTGPDWLSGGAFGLEASVVTVALLTATGLWLLWLLRSRGLVVPPAWRRTRDRPPSA